LGKDKKVIIWGGKTKNNCQENDLVQAFTERGVESEIWNQYGFNKNFKCLDENSKYYVLLRNLFYSNISDFDNYEESKLVKKLRQLETRATLLGDIDGLIEVRDKLKINDVLKDLKIPHIKAYELENKPNSLVKWINETADQFSNGVIIKDRFGGMGKGIVKVFKQGSLYVCDVSCVEGTNPHYINETLNSDELKDMFERYMSDYELIGQPYIKSCHEFNTVNESESIRALDIGQLTFISMRRIAESPINNVGLTKNKLVPGNILKTKTTNLEKEFCKNFSEELGLFFTGYDFIRTKIPYYRDDPGSVYIPQHLRKEEEISLMLEINGLVQFGGIQELYKQHIDIAHHVVSGVIKRMYGKVPF